MGNYQFIIILLQQKWINCRNTRFIVCSESVYRVLVPSLVGTSCVFCVYLLRFDVCVMSVCVDVCMLICCYVIYLL